MYCKQCGNILDENNSCRVCENQTQDQEKNHISKGLHKEKLRKFKFIILAVLIVIVCLVGAKIRDHINQNKYINFVKEGSPNSYQNKTYQEAFSDFFDNPKWSYFEGENGEDVVEFKGNCQYADADVKVTMQFILDIDKGTFQVGAVDMNGVPQNQLITNAIIEAAFKD